MGFSKKTIVILVIVALILAAVTIYSMSSKGKVSTLSPDEKSIDTGKVGINIITPQVEDKLAGDGNGG